MGRECQWQRCPLLRWQIYTNDQARTAAEHIAAVATLGPCELHRKSFCGGGGSPTLF